MQQRGVQVLAAPLLLQQGSAHAILLSVNAGKRRFRRFLGIMALVLLITMSVLVLLFDATQRLAGKKPYWDLNWRGQPVGPGLEIVGAIVIASVPILWLINRKRLDK